MKKFLLPTAGLLLAAAGLVLWTRPTPTDSHPSDVASTGILTSSASAETTVAAPGPASDSAGAHTAVAAPLAPRRLPRGDLAQVVPTASTAVADWRRFTPATLVVEPVPGLPLEFTAKSVTSDGKRTTWIGTNPEQGASLVACGTEAYWTAVLTVPGADEYTIQVSPEAVEVSVQSRGQDGCGVFEAAASANTNGAEALPAAGAAAPLSAAGHTADLLVLYDAGTKAAIGTTEQIENTLTAWVTAMNVFLADSQVDNLQWRLVGVAEAPAYTTTSKMQDDLERLANTSTELGQFARTQRANVGADQVLLLLTGTRDFAGIAYTGSGDWVAYLAVALYGQGHVTAAHELAHNFGCRHDRQQEAIEAAADGDTYSDNDGKYHYGFRFTYNGQDTGTIMSYAPSKVLYFSNPSVTYNGITLGIAGGQSKGADNARWLREHAAAVAGLVPSKVVAAPTITDQPDAVTVTAGQTFSLSVTATGTGLSYQWSKGGTDITGATAATYSKIATTADAGTYSVLVTNTEGSVRSNTATVTVNAAPSTNTGSGGSTHSSGGGGGGGGGGGITILGLLALLAGARRLRAKI